MHQPIEVCRLCHSADLHPILDLGEQELTGIFPARADIRLTRGPLGLALCRRCHLVQLRHSYQLNELYGENYGYRSGLNQSMVRHLRAKVADLLRLRPLTEGDTVVDIGSNDGTTLGFYPSDGFRRVGFDPTGAKFRSYYRSGIRLIEDFFSAHRFAEELGNAARARIVTSIAMFYDLEDPTEFMRQVHSILADDGIWHFEQSYMPEMLRTTAYDTICHEHLEYYGLKQIKWMTDRADLKIIDVLFNAVNGGSFAVTAARKSAPYAECTALIHRVLEAEKAGELEELKPYMDFKERIHRHREALLATLRKLKAEGHRVHGYGASTKGNVILQFCGIDTRLIDVIAEVNEDKFGCFTPGTGIPIVSEAESKARRPDCYLVLPWHFRDNLVERERSFLAAGGRMIFPLPEINIVAG
jgi:hypothetical protein